MQNSKIALAQLPSKIMVIMYILSITFFVTQYVIAPGILNDSNIDDPDFMSTLIWDVALLSMGLYAISVLSSWLPPIIVYPIVAIQVLVVVWKIISRYRAT